MHCYGGKLHSFPKGWTQPCLSPTQFITMYLCGDKDKGVPAFRLLRLQNMKDHFTRAKRIHYEMKKVMFHVERAGRARSLWMDNHLVDWTVEKTLLLYDGIKRPFKFPAKRKKMRRHRELSWRTVYSILMDRKGKLIGET